MNLSDKFIYEIVNNKLTKEEFEKMVNYLKSIMLTSPKISRISSVYNSLGLYNENTKLLTKEEKENIVVFIWASLYIKDEEGNHIIDDNCSIEDVSDIKKEYYDILFGKEEYEVEVIGEFGYSKTNPIQVNCMPAIDEYFSRLLTEDNKRISWERNGSLEVDLFNGPTDEYEITYKNKGLFGKKIKVNLYINCYCSKNSDVAPKGFKLVNLND